MGAKSIIGWIFRPGFTKKYSNPVDGMLFLNGFLSTVNRPVHDSEEKRQDATVATFKEARLKHNLTNKRLAVMQANMARTGYLFLVMALYLLSSLILSATEMGTISNYFQALFPRIDGLFHIVVFMGIVVMGVSAIKYFYQAHLVKNQKLGDGGKKEFMKWVISPGKWLTSPFIHDIQQASRKS